MMMPSNRRLHFGYIIMQPTLRNKKEYKLVFLNKSYRHIYFENYKGSSFSNGNHERLIQFASDAIALLKERCNDFIVDGLVRVDIMESSIVEEFLPPDDLLSRAAYLNSCNYVVNEFEGIQANYKDSAAFDMELTDYFTKTLVKEFNRL